MNANHAIQFLCAQASVRYEHMTPIEKRTFLEAVMTLAEAPEAELAARTLHSLAEFEARQGELFSLFTKQRGHDPMQKPQELPCTSASSAPAETPQG